jgi:predicted metal-dependent enzyme (double-stranded beta helix superfamily)
MSSFDLEAFVQACRAAAAAPTPTAAVRDLLERTLGNDDVAAALPATRAELEELFCSDGLTVMKAVWTPGMTLPPHNHRMWAVIGVYGGTEDNRFFRRADGGLTASGGTSLSAGDVGVLGSDAIHSVANPKTHQLTAAIHVYGGDFMHEPRSVWDGDPPEELPATGETMRGYFERANERGGGPTERS